jgi:phospholipid/cholesterol/gamma-HCH transport system substrate-binding protein
METKANYVAVGAFVLVLLVAGVIGLLWVARVQFNSELTRYDIYFTGSVTGLAKGSLVSYNGIQAGRVVELRIDPQNLQQVRVTVELDQTTPIKSDAVAQLESQGLTGVSYVEISGGSLDAPPLAVQPGQRYPVITSKQSGLQRVFASAPEVLARLVELIDRLQDFLDEKNRLALAKTLDNVQQLTDIAAGHANDIDSILSDAAGTMHDLRATLAEARQAVADLRQLVGEHGEMTQTLKSVDDLTHRLDQLTGHLDALVQENRPPLRDFLQRGLNQATELLVDARGLVAAVTRLSGEIERDPTRFFFNSNRREGYQPR